MSFTHARETIRHLHQAHADHIEAEYAGLSRLPGNPYGVIIKSFGETRTFLQRRADFSNRVILIGNEPDGLLDEIMEHYAEHTEACFIEINPANFSRSEQPFWERLMIPPLRARGV